MLWTFQPLLLVLLTVSPWGGGWEEPSIDPEALIRRVVKSQRRAEEAFEGSTYDLKEVRTTYAKDGQPKEIETRLYYVLSGGNGNEGTRDLVEVNGRPATDDEKRKVAEEDAKGRKQRLERRAASRASAPPAVSGDDDDPLVGTRRLSDLLGMFRFRVAGEEVYDGRLGYVLEFAPKPDRAAKGLGERALGSLEGRVVIDAADFQIRSVAARLARPVKVVGGLAANVKDAEIVYESRSVAKERWFPCRVDLHMKGRTAIFFRLDSGFRFEFANLRSFHVETESAVRPDP
jgi:hypothetical protein